MSKGYDVDPLTLLKKAGYRCYYCSYSALDRFLQIDEPGPVYLLTDSSLISLAREFEDLQYPRYRYEDAALTHEGTRYFFRCYDEMDPPAPSPYTVQELLYDPERDVYLDPKGIYPHLRQKKLVMRAGAASPLVQLQEAARLVSRYHYEIPGGEHKDGIDLPAGFPAEAQRDLLLAVLSGKKPAKGLSLLLHCGFIRRFWPELYELSRIPQAKDFHPEGDVWAHTLETFSHRKESDPVLSLALLLHDIGKPAASGTLERPFDRHAELGADIAFRFLRRLGFDTETIRQVTFLIRFHMMPAALKSLPLFRTRPIMSSPLFHLLLELYRADLSASYQSPTPYYEACRIYRSFQKRQSNPFRRADGRKQTRLSPASIHQA